MKCRECGHSVLVDMQMKSEKNVHRYLYDNGWLTINKCVERKYRIRIDDIEESVYTAMCTRMEQIEIAHKQKEAPDAEAESIKADILKLDSEIRFGI